MINITFILGSTQKSSCFCCKCTTYVLIYSWPILVNFVLQRTADLSCCLLLRLVLPLVRMSLIFLWPFFVLQTHYLWKETLFDEYFKGGLILLLHLPPPPPPPPPPSLSVCLFLVDFELLSGNIHTHMTIFKSGASSNGTPITSSVQILEHFQAIQKGH